jgi:hypothetical protein
MIHNIDGKSETRKIPKYSFWISFDSHIYSTSIDHINTAYYGITARWIRLLIKVWHDVTTYTPYVNEITFRNLLSFFSRQKERMELSSLGFICSKSVPKMFGIMKRIGSLANIWNETIKQEIIN